MRKGLLNSIVAAALAIPAVAGAVQLPELPEEKTRDSLKQHIANQGKVVGMATIQSGDIHVVETDDGSHYYITGNRRYLIEGRIVDLWRKIEITSLDQARTSSRVLPKHFGITDDSLPLLKVGNPSLPRMGYVFVDPNCGYCKQLMQFMEDNKDKYHFDLVLTPIMGERSALRAQQLWCAKDRNKATRDLIFQSNSDNPAKSDCDARPLAQAEVLRQMVGVRGVPFLLREDGLTLGGLPKGKDNGIGTGLDEWLARL
ncbi:DsbC family protein [Ferrimonas kyonanensis]|uniref:DsbC family protein n=1 Tax=Ferrimonas kyonanensis TaxID=364763 RepID=UPI000400E61A|nr:DsbC family protein [Ferrimonas kyonanensis]